MTTENTDIQPEPVHELTYEEPEEAAELTADEPCGIFTPERAAKMEVGEKRADLITAQREAEFARNVLTMRKYLPEHLRTGDDAVRREELEELNAEVETAAQEYEAAVRGYEALGLDVDDLYEDPADAAAEALERDRAEEYHAHVAEAELEEPGYVMELGL